MTACVVDRGDRGLHIYHRLTSCKIIKWGGERVVNNVTVLFVLNYLSKFLKVQNKSKIHLTFGRDLDICKRRKQEKNEYFVVLQKHL
jgi:hypothetical protein